MALIWDIETKEQIRGEDFADYRARTGIALSVLYDDDLDTWTLHGENDLDDLARRLESAGEVVTYGGVRFDHPVLDNAVGRRIYIASELDLCDAIFAAKAGRRDPVGTWKLGEVCRRTLGARKFGEGSDAPKLYAAGRFAELATYAIRDVWLTRELLRFIRRFGYVIDGENRKLQIALPIHQELNA